MFGKDVGDSIKEENIECVLANGEMATDEDLQKWAEQEKNKKEGGGDEGGDDKDVVDESIQSFKQFMFEEASDAGDPDEGDEAGDPDEGDEAGDSDEADAWEEDDMPPPATYLITYDIGADGQATKDFT